MKVLQVLTLISFLCGALSSNDAQSAGTLLLINGRIYTGNKQRPWVEGLAIDRGRISAVGLTEELLRRKGTQSHVIDLSGHTVIPGIVDSHVHMLLGGMALHGLNLSTPTGSTWPDEADKLISLLRDFAKAHPRDRVLFARADFDSSTSTPSHELLDRAVPDRPLIVHHWSEHALWLNSRALRLADITRAPLPDPLEERGVVREKNAEPRGVVVEAAMDRVEQSALGLLSMADKLTLAREAQRYLNQFGITSVVNASGTLPEIELYKTLRDRHQMNVRMKVAMGTIGVPHKLTPEFLRNLEAARDLSDPDWLSANTVKFFADTAGHGDAVYTAEELRSLAIELDRRGYQLMSHALFPSAVEMTLNAFEGVTARNGTRDRRLRIEHANRLSDIDLSRLSQLSVIASMQPAFCCSTDRPGVPPTDRWQSLIRHDVVLAFGSDWPCSWPPDPFRAIAQAVTRAIWESRQGFGAGQAGGAPTGAISAPEERITVSQAVDAFTAGGAYASFRESSIGSLEVGKLADLAVLSQDVFSVPPDRIAQTQVTMTIVGGRVAFQQAK
jgi:predicted amidohydrolase YtcJ